MGSLLCGPVDFCSLRPHSREIPLLSYIRGTPLLLVTEDGDERFEWTNIASNFLARYSHQTKILDGSSFALPPIVVSLALLERPVDY